MLYHYPSFGGGAPHGYSRLTFNSTFPLNKIFYSSLMKRRGKKKGVGRAFPS
jgi:hypothetical protein